jgi:hypothetical protein
MALTLQAHNPDTEAGIMPGARGQGPVALSAIASALWPAHATLCGCRWSFRGRKWLCWCRSTSGAGSG